MPEQTNIALAVPLDLNEKLKKMCPAGTKAQAIRELLILLVEAQLEMGTSGYIVDSLLRKQCKIVIKEKEN